MSTRSSIWLGESEEKSVHIYWELADRTIENGRMIGAQIFMAVDTGDSNEEIAVRLPKEIATEIMKVLDNGASAPMTIF